MINRIIKISYPMIDAVNSYKEKVPSAGRNIYDMVEFFENNIFSNKIKLVKEEISESILIKSIINLHNKEGIKDLDQIKKMIEDIQAGKEIVQPSKLPNIKLVKTDHNKLILFDGHHSLLAYMATGRKYLQEVPHLIVIGEKGSVTDEEIKVFFGEHQGDWRTEVINWQAPQEKQLGARREKNMGELLTSLLGDIYLHTG